MDREQKILRILRFALTKKYTVEDGDVIRSSDGQVFDLYRDEIKNCKPRCLDIKELMDNKIMELCNVHSYLYDTDSNMSVLLALAATINHNFRVIGVIVKDVTRLVDINKLLSRFDTYPHSFAKKLTYHLSITKYHDRSGLEKAYGIEFGGVHIVNEVNPIDVMDIDPFGGLAIKLDTNRLTVSVVTHGDDHLLLDISIHNTVKAEMNIWNLYYDSDHQVGDLIKMELEKLGLLDLYLQRP